MTLNSLNPRTKMKLYSIRVSYSTQETNRNLGMAAMEFSISDLPGSDHKWKDITREGCCYWQQRFFSLHWCSIVTPQKPDLQNCYRPKQHCQLQNAYPSFFLKLILLLQLTGVFFTVIPLQMAHNWRKRATFLPLE